jgi:hypothetical protein
LAYPSATYPPPARKSDSAELPNKAGIRPKGINYATKQLADGTLRTYWYAWKGGPRLRGEPGTPEFIASYNEAVASRRAELERIRTINRKQRALERRITRKTLAFLQQSTEPTCYLTPAKKHPLGALCGMGRWCDLRRAIEGGSGQPV